MNLANKITLTRLILVPLYIFFAIYTDYKLVTLIIFACASITDFLDGYVARKYNMITNFGKFLDPLADKILTLSAFIIFSSQSTISPIITIIIVSREIVISVFRAIAASKDVVIAASIYGKFKTVFQIVTIIIIYIYEYFNIEMDMIVTTFIFIMTLLTIISGVDYLYKNRKVINEM